jgi:pseudouridine synthase
MRLDREPLVLIEQVRVVCDYEKEYRVLIARRPDEEQLETWRRGVVLEDGYKTAPAQVWVDRPEGKGAWLRVILKEGRKRQIREMGEQVGPSLCTASQPPASPRR